MCLGYRLGGEELYEHAPCAYLSTPDEDEGFEPLRFPLGREQAAHGADRMSDEDEVGKLQPPTDLEYVGCVAVESCVLLAIVRSGVRFPGADMVEEHYAMTLLE